MHFFTVRDLRSYQKNIWQTLADTHEVVITNFGKPSVLMLEINEFNMEEVIDSVRQAKAMRALNRLRSAANHNGTAKMTPQQIKEALARTKKECIG